MKRYILFAAIVIIVIAVAALYFIPLKSKDLFCVANDERYSFLLGQTEAYEKTSGHTPANNEGICAPSNAKATLYLL